MLIRPATEMNIVLTAGENPFQLEVTEYHHDPQLVNIHQFFPALEHNFARAVSGRLGEERQVNHSCQEGCIARGEIQVCLFSKYEKDCVYYTWKTCAFWFLPSDWIRVHFSCLELNCRSFMVGVWVGWLIVWWVACFLLVCLWFGDLCMPYNINNSWIIHIYIYIYIWLKMTFVHPEVTLRSWSLDGTLKSKN